MCELYEQISCFEKLKLANAQELYKKAMNVSNSDLKKMYMDKLILGTLHVVYNYIAKHDLMLFSSSLYSIDDIISAFTEVWIQKIYKGELLNISRYSNLFTSTFFNEVYVKMGGINFEISDLFGISYDKFVDLFYSYFKLKNANTEFDYNAFRENICGDDDIDEDILFFFEEIYKKLSLSKDEISKFAIKNYLKLFIDSSMFGSFSNDMVDGNDMETEIANKDNFQGFVRNLDLILKNDREKDIIFHRFGLGDNAQMSYDELAKKYGITIERIRQIEVKAIRKLRYPQHNLSRYC